ncbi:MAG: NAD(P)(+) transhydrogenase (Re/Si-specific) subunit alpha, partial [Kiritimatiellia bacterium]
MNILLLKEQNPKETRIAALPESVKKLVSLEARVQVESGLGS